MRLVLQKYKWSDTLESNEVNFFSSAVKELINEIELTDYLIRGSLSDIAYSFSNVDENNSAYLTASNVSFKCINDIGNGTALQDIFEIYNKNAYIKFKLTVYDDDDNNVYSGIITKDSVSYANREDWIIDIEAVGYEIEFRDYFLNERILPGGEIEYCGLPVSIALAGFKVHALVAVLQKLFQGVNFQFYDEILTTFLNKYYISEYPYTYSPLTSMYEEDLLECKAGYNSFYDEGISKFTFLNNLCTSKGWIWYFIKDKLYIKQLADYNLSVHTIDNIIISHSVKNEIHNYQVDNVVIQAGEYYANSGSPLTPSFPLNFNSQSGLKYTGDLRRFVFSNVNPEIEEIRAFRKLRYYSTGGNHYYTVNHSQHNTYKFIKQDDYKYYFTKYYTAGAGINQASPYELTVSNPEYVIKKSMYVNTGVCQRGNGGYVDITNARGNSGRYYGNGNSLATTNVITNTEYGVTGNIGEAMIWYNSELQKYFTYEMEMRSENAKNNFKTYLRNANNVILNLTVNELITNPFQNITLLNYPYANINDKVFIINSLSFNLNTKTTNLTIQLI